MNWPVAPILLPLFTALAALFWGRSGVGRRWLVAGSAAAQLAVSLGLVSATLDGRIFVLGLGAWPARFGIVLVVDLLSALMLTLSTLVALASVLYAYAESPARVEHPLRAPLTQFLVMGINLTFCTGDLFNLFVAFEIMLIASYALLTLEADDWDIKHAFPYVGINLFGSALFLSACGLTYALFGTLNFAQIALRAAPCAEDPRLWVLALLLIVVFGIKAGLFPLYYWLPNSYPTLPIPTSALFAGMLTKVGVYVLLRVFGTVLPHELAFAHTLLAWLAGATMLLAVMGAIARNFIRGILSFHILSQIGFMVLGIGLFTPLSVAACILYIIHHIVVKSSLFLIGGVAMRLNGTDDLERMGNLWKRAPWLGALFLCQALSLAGLPPLSGFWGKYLIVVAGLEQGQYALVAVCILASILTLFSMVKIWNGAFWTGSDRVPVRTSDRRWRAMTAVVAGLACVSLAIGLGADGVVRIALEAAERLLDQHAYADAALGFLGKTAAIPTP
ncbi:MAG TPA: proton-conducting transporter membrane subunit [Verrucomicrobiota bacterium]|nr:proton-conducting transporter membrane subunit [Verrucomicrobiota bacterium]